MSFPGAGAGGSGTVIFYRSDFKDLQRKQAEAAQMVRRPPYESAGSASVQGLPVYIHIDPTASPKL
jgi:hypothetical protein